MSRGRQIARRAPMLLPGRTHAACGRPGTRTRLTLEKHKTTLQKVIIVATSGLVLDFY